MKVLNSLILRTHFFGAILIGTFFSLPAQAHWPALGILDPGHSAVQSCEGHFCFTNPHDAFNHYCKIITQPETPKEDLLQARYLLAKLIYAGAVGQKNNLLAAALLEQSAAQGHGPSLYSLATLHFKGESGSQNWEEARRLFGLASQAGHVLGMTHYARMLYHGQGGAPDLVLARENFKTAAYQGNAEAQNAYGLMLFFGEGGAKDPFVGRLLIKEAAEQGFEDARQNLETLKKSTQPNCSELSTSSTS